MSKLTEVSKLNVTKIIKFNPIHFHLKPGQSKYIIIQTDKAPNKRGRDRNPNSNNKPGEKTRRRNRESSIWNIVY